MPCQIHTNNPKTKPICALWVVVEQNKQCGIIQSNLIYAFMIARAASRIMRQFGRLVKPKINKFDNIFQLMKDKTSELQFIEAENNRRLSTTKFMTPAQHLAQLYEVPETVAQDIANVKIGIKAYSPIWMKPYRASQKIGGHIVVEDNAQNVEMPYHPSNSNLKLHYSINKQVPRLTQYQPSKSTAYIFNLPANIDDKKLLMELGYQQVKNIRISYCMLGLPAYAVVEFTSDTYLSERMLSNDMTITVDNNPMRIFWEPDRDRLQLERRQLVLKGLPQTETPATMLQKLSQYGRVVHMELPTQVYREPSIKQVKQLYKNERSPIRINYHRKNGTIESEYYPPYQPSQFRTSLYEQKQAEYKRRLRYCQNVDVYEGREGQIRTKAKGFCIVTYSCQEELQNCYLQLRTTVKMELLNGREQFEFDEKHREALLRFIDNSYIQKCLDNNPTKQYDDAQKYMDSALFQSLYLSMVYEDLRRKYYYNQPRLMLNEKDQGDQLLEHIQYRQYLNELKSAIGRPNADASSTTVGNHYGKSFDQLAEQQLYGMKLKQRAADSRYQVNIDDYVRERNDVPQPKKRKTRAEKEKLKSEDLDQNDLEQKQLRENLQETDQNDIEIADLKVGDRDPQETERRQRIRLDRRVDNKKKFSTMKMQDNTYREKTLQEKIKSHMLYNKFVRDTINEYMGFFPTEKLQSQFNRKQPTFTNPQNLVFVNGTEIITEYEVRNVLQFSTASAQQFYNSFVRDNQIAKSLNVDIEETMLKNFEQNSSRSLFALSQVGVVKQQYECEDKDIEATVAKFNMQAQFGEEYRIVEDEESGTRKIVKIAKIQHIVPFELQSKLRAKTKQFQKSKDFDPKKMELIHKHMNSIWNGQPLSDQLAEAFQLQKGQPFNTQKFAQQLCSQLGIRKKDFQKLMNLSNYSQQQLEADYAMQLQISKTREKFSERKASDYAKDPSKIITKDKDGKAIVSKFRQV